ncbi:hypothetical protein C8J57DRAFT_1544506 [Mycena rebaudengoi]|nr:hypothetical protein C8J57DRAFT_1544506 [Mycena rebaudengoi]
MSRGRLFLVLFLEEKRILDSCTASKSDLFNFGMFSKIFTFGLAALTFVGAAPATDFQSPMAISCNVNVQAAGPSAATYSLESGRYGILDAERSTWLRIHTPDNPVYVAPAPAIPATYAEWEVEALQEGGRRSFTITNIGLKSPVYVGDDDDKTIIAGGKKPEVRFIIEPAGGDIFVVQSVDEDLVWTRKTPDDLRSEACYHRDPPPVPYLSVPTGAAPPGNRRRSAKVEIR